MGDQVEGLDAIDLSEGLTIYVRNNKKETPIRLDVLAERYAKGESLKALGKEVQVSEPTLRKYLDDAGLLAKPEDRNTPLNRLASQLPSDEVIERYEGGESVNRIVASLKKAGTPATAGAVERVLDQHKIVRHAASGVIPKDAPQGFSVASAAALSRAALFGKYGDWVHRDTRPSPDEVRRMRMHNRAAKSPERKKSSPRLKKRSSKRPSASNDFVPGGGRPPGWSNLHVIDAGKPRFSTEGPLSEQNLMRLAERHEQGKGESIKELADSIGVYPGVLGRALREAGYTVSNRDEWTRRELKVRAKDLVRLYCEEEKDFDFILGFLRAHDLHVSLDKLRRLLRSEGVTFRPDPPAVREKSQRSSPSFRRRTTPAEKGVVLKRRDQNGLNLPKQVQPNASDPRWNAIKDRLEELAKRILEDGEPVRGIADELGVDHNWLAQALKKTGHLPNMNLSRLRKQMRLAREKS